MLCGFMGKVHRLLTPPLLCLVARDLWWRWCPPNVFVATCSAALLMLRGWVYSVMLRARVPQQKGVVTWRGPRALSKQHLHPCCTSLMMCFRHLASHLLHVSNTRSI